MKRQHSNIASEIDRDYKLKQQYRCRKCEFFEEGKCKEGRCVYDKTQRLNE